MRQFFLSYFIDEDTPIYGGDKGQIKIYSLKSIDKGDTSNNLLVHFPTHIGTHIDFPYHFSTKGKKCHNYPASFWNFENVGFLECPIEDVEKCVESISGDIEILLLKTGFGLNRNKEIYWAQQPVIPSHFGSLFRNKFPKLRVFGFDMISLTSKLNRDEGKLAHINFLVENDILIVEDMNLRDIVKAPDRVIIAPLQIYAADGVPCTVIAYNN